jgi:hypothetical protein
MLLMNRVRLIRAVIMVVLILTLSNSMTSLLGTPQLRGPNGPIVDRPKTPKEPAGPSVEFVFRARVGAERECVPTRSGGMACRMVPTYAVLKTFEGRLSLKELTGPVFRRDLPLGSIHTFRWRASGKPLRQWREAEAGGFSELWLPHDALELLDPPEEAPAPEKP